MVEKNSEIPVLISKKEVAGYSFAFFADIIASQFFSFFLFTFYYAVVGIDVNLITIVFIVWSIWNAINDPLMGALSDKTNTKWGKRKPWIMLGFIPMCIILFLLWTPPIGDQILSLIYMLIMILLFDTFYTMFSLNQTALFPEMYRDLEARSKVNNIVQIIGVIGLILAVLLPSFFIPNYTDPQYLVNYSYTGLFMAIVTAISVVIFIKFGIRESEEFKKDSEKAPSFFASLKMSIKNKAFTTYVIANFAIFYVFGMLPIITPLYGRFVLGIENSLILSLLLGIAFISAAAFMILWNKLAVKLGVKKAQILSMISFIATLLPFVFITEIIGAFIAFIIVGIGLAGALFFRAVTMSTIIDDDELKTGVRREGGYFGINALFIRLSTIAIFLTISMVFNSVGWRVFDPVGTTEETIFGLRMLMFIFPAIFLVIGIISMSRFPIGKEDYIKIKEEVKELHQKKKAEL